MTLAAPIPEGLRRYTRQMVLPGIGVEGQQRLRQARVVVLGVGALGTALASGVVRAGVGYVRLIDRDFIEEHNLQRQMLFDEDDITANLPKAVAAAEKLRRVNSHITIEPVVEDVTPTNIERLITDCDLVLDGGDNFELRMLLNDAALKHNIPWIYGAVIATHGVVMPILPDDGPCFRCLLPDLPAPGATPTCDTAGVLGTVPQIIAAFQVTGALKWLTGQHQALCRDLRYIDVWHNLYERVQVLKGEGVCPACDERRFEFLEGRHHTRSETLCGRDAVQVRPAGDVHPNFTTLAERLAALGDVQHNAYVLRFAVEGCEMTLFQDGRAIIQGTSDEGVARSLYTRYIGL
jgi:adenylyltransferase/sulfurtransferase